MYSIEDLYNYLDTGVAGLKRPGGFIEPLTGPTDKGRTLGEVQEKIKDRCITCEDTIWDDPDTPEAETRWCENGDGTVTDMTIGLVFA